MTLPALNYHNSSENQAKFNNKNKAKKNNFIRIFFCSMVEGQLFSLAPLETKQGKSLTNYSWPDSCEDNYSSNPLKSRLFLNAVAEKEIDLT